MARYLLSAFAVISLQDRLLRTLEQVRTQSFKDWQEIESITSLMFKNSMIPLLIAGPPFFSSN